MVRMVSVNFSSIPAFTTPIYYRKVQYSSLQELHLKAPADIVVSSPQLRGATVKIISSTYSCNCTTAQSRDSNGHVGLTFRDMFALDYLLSDVSYSLRKLTGYWVGPDTEDGWGFVEALIVKI